MMPEEQIIAIVRYRAEKEGFYTLDNGSRAKEVPIKFIEPGAYGPWPDYLNDLNAMHAAEETLSVTLKGEFVNILSHITGDNYWASIHSAAEWRAQAFLRTIGKWKD